MRRNIDLEKILEDAIQYTAEFVWQWMDDHPDCCRPRLGDMNEYDSLFFNVEYRLKINQYHPYTVAVCAHVRTCIRIWFRDGGANELWDMWKEQQRELNREKVSLGWEESDGGNDYDYWDDEPDWRDDHHLPF